MHLENLERRALLSVSFQHHLLSIVGTHKNDTLNLSVKGRDTVIVSSFNTRKTFHLHPGDTINIDMMAGNDRVSIVDASRFPTTILGGSGNDSIDGSGGNDVIDGGSGADTLHGNGGDDSLRDTTNDTVIDGGAGFDGVDFSAATTPIIFNMTGKHVEMVQGGSGNDSLTGSDGDDAISGNGGNDTIHAGAGNDYLDGGAGHDSLLAEKGNDIIINQDGASDHVDGGFGFDLAQEDKSGSKSLDNFAGIERFIDRSPSSTSLGSNNTVKRAMAAPVTKTTALRVLKVSSAPVATLSHGILSIPGTSSADSISVIRDSSGHNISVSVGSRSASFSLASVRGVTIDAGGGNDSISLQRSDGSRALTVAATILGGNGNDHIIGGGSSDEISGGSGNDTRFGMKDGDRLTGDDGNDSLDGGAGNDLLDGGAGADVMHGGSGLSDSVDYSGRSRSILVDISNDGRSNEGESGEGDRVFSDIENIFGGSGSDTLIGNSFANVISGGAGNDSITGNGGHDKLIGGAGGDNVTAGSDVSLFSLVDSTRDTFNGTLDHTGRPTGAFVSGDIGKDFSTASRLVLE